MTHHIPGTLYPTNGAKPHLPTMCHHRTMVRRNGYTRTVLCYENGVYELVRPDGTPAYVETSEGPMPFRFCAKHQLIEARHYRGATWRQLKARTPEEGQEPHPYASNAAANGVQDHDDRTAQGRR